MYIYLYDPLTKNRRYDGVIRDIETRLTDYGIAGKIIRLQPMMNAKALIDDEVRRGAKTVVVVGNDETIGHVLSKAASCPVTFGFIPVGPDNRIAQVLGIPVGSKAVDMLSRRRRLKLDVGWVNGRYFISQLHILPADISITYDEKFTVSSRFGKMELAVCNLLPLIGKGKKGYQVKVHPQDGKLEAFIRPMAQKTAFREVYEEPSIFPFSRMEVHAKKSFVVVADGRKTREEKLSIRLANGKIDMIVGKDRAF